MRFAPLLAASLLALPLAAAAQGLPGNPSPAAVQAGAYKVEPSHTQIQFSVNHMGFNEYFGRFSGASGELRLDPAHPAASTLTISAPTASVSTTSATLDGELKSADWLDAARDPAITFRSTAVTPTGPASARVAGELTLHGVTRPLTLQVRFMGAGVNPIDKSYTAGFQATGAIKRSDFGVSKYVPLVSDEVTLTLSGAFTKVG